MEILTGILILIGTFTLSMVIASFIAPVMARLFDKTTYRLGNWLLKHFPSSGIIQRPYEQPKQRYSRVYVPKPLKDVVNYIIRPVNRGDSTMKNSKSIKNSDKSNEYPLSKQSLNTGNNPRLEFKANCINKDLHRPQSNIGEKDASTKREPNPFLNTHAAE